jgi:hypothetical protein
MDNWLVVWHLFYSWYLEWSNQVLLNFFYSVLTFLLAFYSIWMMQVLRGQLMMRFINSRMLWSAVILRLKLMLECVSNKDEQNMFYNDWTFDHYIGAVSVFCPNGMIPICCYYVPGTVHDSSIATIGNVYMKNLRKFMLVLVGFVWLISLFTS